MSIARCRDRSLALALYLSLVLARPLHAGWGLEPVQVRATAALCPAVAAVSDGHGGALVAWQENDATGGFVRAQHLLANGDVDPAWGDDVIATDRSAARTVLGAVGDGTGGAYLWWMEGASLFIQRITRLGTIAPGWSASGRHMGGLLSADFRPSVVPDGASGVYVGMLTSPTNSLHFDVRIFVRHLNASGGPAAGWPASGRTFPEGPGGWNWTISSFAMDLAPEGGLWLAWHRLGTSSSGAGDLGVLRLTPAGLPAGGWSALGVLLAPFYPTFPGAPWPYYEDARTGSEVGVAHDDAGGAFVLSRQSNFDPLTLEYLFQNSLRRLDASGAPAAGWSADGVTLSDGPEYLPAGPTAEATVRALGDERGGVFTGLPLYPSEFSSTVDFTRRSAAGDVLPGGVDVGQQGIEFAPRGDGGMFVASFKPSGATGPCEADAYISVSQSDPGAGFHESKPSASAIRYGDIGLTATGDGEAIFAWSQLIDRQGVYAIRLGPAGIVTGVPPAPVIGSPSLRVRFVRGEGVHAVAAFTGSSRVTFALHDLAGRRVASFASDATLGADVVLPGTRDLPGGVYFAMASDGVRALNARVLVLR